MKKYEINYFLPLESSEEEIQKTANQVETLIQTQDGLLVGERRMNKIKLAYRLRGRKEMAIITSQFQLEPAKINDLRQGLTKIKEIVRFMILANEPAPVKPLKPRRKPTLLKKEALPEPGQSQIGTETLKEKPIKEKKVELEQIEKKLNELLE